METPVLLVRVVAVEISTTTARNIPAYAGTSFLIGVTFE